jgi:hypothetical protein
MNDVVVKHVYFLYGGIELIEGRIILNRNLKVIECIFNDIELEDGNGSVINGVVKGGKQLEIIGIFVFVIYLFIYLFIFFLNKCIDRFDI